MRNKPYRQLLGKATPAFGTSERNFPESTPQFANGFFITLDFEPAATERGFTIEMTREDAKLLIERLNERLR